MFEYILAAGLAASILGTVAGFGTSALFLSLVLFFFDFTSAIILAAIFALAGNFGRVALFRSHLDKKLIKSFAIPSIILTIIGVLLLKYASPNILKVLLGFVLLGFSFISFFNPKGTKMKKSKKNVIIGGGLSGFMLGLVGVGGPVIGAFLDSFRLGKRKYVATAAGVALLIDIFRLPLYFTQGMGGSFSLYYIPALFAIAIVGSYIGKFLVKKLSQKLFRRIIIISIFSISLKFIIEGIYYLV